ncbi:MAG: HalD/BesD family halogenase [Woeseiaceae bacterium]
MRTAPKSANASSRALADIVDLDRYPLDRPDSVELDESVQRCRADLQAHGCSVLEGFFAPGIETMRREAAELAPLAWFQERFGNPYSSPDDPTLPEDHPVRSFLKRDQGFVAGDLIAGMTALRRVYHHAGFRRFVAACLELDEIHEYADPLGCLVVNVIREGACHPWHFDTNEFVVSTLVQAPEAGGNFEYCPGIRSPENENFARVGRVIRDEDRSEVRVLGLRPGDIQLFLGRFALHRVTPVEGSRPRLSVIFSYARTPNMVATADRSRHLFGRATDIHRERRELSSRADSLMD